MRSGPHLHHHPYGWLLFAPLHLSAAPMPHLQNSAFRGGKQGGMPYRRPTHQNPSPQNDTVTLGGVYLPPAARLGPKLGRLAWGARNFGMCLLPVPLTPLVLAGHLLSRSWECSAPKIRAHQERQPRHEFVWSSAWLTRTCHPGAPTQTPQSIYAGVVRGRKVRER